MQNKLSPIFNSITPDNIKNIPIISDGMQIFIELLEELSPISSDIRIALSEQTTDSIAEELPKIYLWDYFSMIENLKNSKIINEKFRLWNSALKPNLFPIGQPIIGNKLIINYFIVGQEGEMLTLGDNSDIDFEEDPLNAKLNLLKRNLLQNKAENYYVNRLFKQSKGLKKSINFIYDILNEYLVNSTERLPLIYEETGIPFRIKMSGSIDRDIYDESVSYLAHPLGFVYDYTYISELKFEDIYSIKKLYKINMLEVRCLYGNTEKYEKEVSYIEERYNYLKIIFKDNSYLLQENNVVRYFENDILIKLYPVSSHCSIYLEYEIIYRTDLSETIDFSEKVQFPDENVIISDNLTWRETEEFDFGFLIGTDIVGEKIVRNDSDQFETVAIKNVITTQEFQEQQDIVNINNILDEILSTHNLEQIAEYEFTLNDESTINEEKESEDTFNASNIDEEFTIELI